MLKQLSGLLKCFTRIICMALSAYLADCVPVAATELSHGGQVSKDQSTSLPGSGAGQNLGVALHTGQHMEAFPLITLPTQGVGNIDVSISYNGNTYYTATHDNRTNQTSWVGLGFALGFESIVSNQHSSVSPADDDYFYVDESGGMTQLISTLSAVSSVHNYVTSDDRHWKISRSDTVVNGYTYVIGWTVVREDGVTYQFGDFQYSESGGDATHYLLHWGNFVGYGATANDDRIPCQWDIARIEAGSSNWVQFGYTQRVAQLRVNSAPTHLTSHSYTAASQIHSITASTGYSVEFKLGTRSDAHPILDISDYEFFSTTSLDSIYLLFHDQKVSRIGFGHAYLNSAGGNAGSKLLLTKIVPWDSSGLVQLPATEFSYFTNSASPTYGSIRAIKYPDGGLKRLSYSAVPVDSVFTSLNGRQNHSYADDGASLSCSRSTIISKLKLSGETTYKYELTAWNGYWHSYVLPDVYDATQDSAICAGDGWVALYSYSLQKMLVYRWSGGRWIREELPMGWTPSWQVELHAGNEMLVCLDVKNDYTNPRKIKAAYLYKRSHDGWAEHLLFDRQNYDDKLSYVGLGLDVWGIQIEKGNQPRAYQFSYGTYNYAAHAPETGLTEWEYDIITVVGTNYVGWTEPLFEGISCGLPGDHGYGTYPDCGYICHVARSTGTGWAYNQIGSVQYPVGKINGLVPLAMGIGMLYDWSHYDDQQLLGVWSFGGSNGELVEVGSEPFGTSGCPTNSLHPSGGNSFGTARKHLNDDWVDFSMYEWNGSSLQQNVVYPNIFTVCDNTKYLDAFVTPEMCTFWAHRGSVSSLSATERVGRGQWNFSQFLNTGLYYQGDDGLWRPALHQGAEGQASGTGRTLNPLHHYRYLFDKGDFESNWTTINLGNYVETSTDVWDNTFPYVFRDRCYMSFRHEDASYFQHYRDSWIGSPQLQAISRVESYATGDSSGSPVIVEYSYTGGLLDESATGPRFARTKVMAPRLSSESSQNYVLHYFYNDMFFGQSQFSSLDNSVLPSLSAANGVDYLFDGLEFKTVAFDSAWQETHLSCLDTTKNFFTAAAQTIDGTERYTVRLDSTHSRIDKVPSDIAYNYDNFTGAVAVRRTHGDYGPGKIIVDSTVLGFRQYPNLLADNVLNVQTDHIVLVDSSGTRKVLDRKKSTFQEHSYWQLASTRTFPDFALMPDTVNQLVSDTVDPSNVDTDISVTVPFDQVVSYSLSCSSGCWTRIRLNGITIDSVGPYGRLRADIPLAVFQGDALLLDGTVSGGSYWPPNKFVALTWAPTRQITGGRSICAFAAGSDNSYDSFGNLLSWCSSEMDTSGAKFSPDGSQKIASVVDGFIGNVLLFDAEHGLDAQGVGYDGWQNVGQTLGTIDDQVSFTGKRSYKLVDDPGTSIPTMGLYRVLVKDSIKRPTFALSFWMKTVDTVYVEAVLYLSGNFADFVTQSKYSGSGGWTRVVCLIDPTQVSADRNSWDSLEIRIGLTSKSDASLYIDNVRFAPIDASVATSVYDQVSGVISAQLDNDNLPSFPIYDSFRQVVAHRDHKSRLLDTTSVYFSVLDPANNGIYNPVRPNYTRTVKYIGADSAVSVTYRDGLGRPLETRSLIEYDGSRRTLVSGGTYSNAKGQILRQYKPYLDIVAPYGLLDYSDSIAIDTEAKAYYNGAPGNGPACQDWPYSAFAYEVGIKGRLESSAGPGIDHYMGSGNIQRFSRATEIVGSDTLVAQYNIDADNIKTATKSDSRGRYEKSFPYYRDIPGSADSIIMVTHHSVMGNCDSVFADTSHGSGSVPLIFLRAAWNNDRGLTERMWKVDYGTVRMLYDRRGALRFVQNDLRFQEGKFVYFKYDAAGRKIEEGIMGNAANFFTQDSANSPSFPKSSNTPNIRYQWVYDYYVASDSAILAPGMLVRVNDSASIYYRNFRYYPTDDSDKVIVRLPGFSVLKSITHVYNKDGSLKELTILPQYPAQTGKRTHQYEYGVGGKLKTVKNGNPTDPELVQNYAEYIYNPDGSVDTTRLGVSTNPTRIPQFFDTVQVVNYFYDNLGRYIGCNDPAAVVSSLSGGRHDNDHFGEQLTFEDVSSYKNGRLTKAISHGSGTASRTWRYSYNDMRWLTFADEGSVPSEKNHDQRFFYNSLGQRVKSVTYTATDSSVTTYQYDAAFGSSKITRYSSMPSGRYLRYDALGNLTSDSARNIYKILWDYRNLMTRAEMPSISAAYKDAVDCSYDEAGNRLKKRYSWYYWVSCGGGGGGIESMMQPGGDSVAIESDSSFISVDSNQYNLGDSLFSQDSSSDLGGSYSSSGSGGQQCPASASNYTFYLYDNGNLVATFDGAGAVIDMYVVGPSGRIATYGGNSDNNLNYFMPDYLGSERVVVKGVPSMTPTVVSYYNYYPFGKTFESMINYQSMQQYGGHERDQHGSFDYLNFGAREYDPNVGMFLSLDKASQFANGYSYAGNNPVMAIDPDGNFAFFPVAYSALQVMGGASLLYSAFNAWVSFWVNHDLSAAAMSIPGLGIGGIADKVGGIKGFGITCVSSFNAKKPLKSLGFAIAQNLLTNSIKSGYENYLRQEADKRVIGYLTPDGFVSAEEMGAGGQSKSVDRLRKKVSDYIKAYKTEYNENNPCVDYKGAHLYDKNGVVDANGVSPDIEMTELDIDYVIAGARANSAHSQAVREALKAGVTIYIDSKAKYNFFIPEEFTIVYNPYEKGNLITGIRPPWIGLGHEFSHAMLFAAGKFYSYASEDGWGYLPYSGKGNMRRAVINHLDFNAIKFDNFLRSQVHVKQRTDIIDNFHPL